MRTSWIISRKECPICHEQIGATAFKKHVNACKGVKEKVGPKDAQGKTQKWYEAMHSRQGRGTNQFLKAKELGLPKPEISEETRRKRSENNKKRSAEWNKENGKKISKTCLEKSAKGEWHTSLAKYMHYSYKGVDLHGKWELAYAQYLDKEGVAWVRCKDRFAYIFENKQRFYTPDFFLVNSKQYVEIKGYETEKDRAKWSQFPLSLTVLKFKELKALVSKYPDIDALVKN